LSGRFWTFAELEAELPESNQPAELWDGELIMPPSPSFEHQENALSFYKQLDAWVAGRRLGKVVAAPMDMVLSPRRAVQPDVLFISKDRLNIIRRCVRGPADLVAEVISPGTRHRDRIEKRDLYEQHGVREFWLIDSEAKTVEVFFLENEQYRLLGRFRSGQTAESRLLAGFKVAVDDLFASAEA
jgi:Uma2 family endonuclease